MPDRRENYLPVPISRSGLIRHPDSRADYTPLQRQHIEQITQQYLKRHKLPVSYQYFTQVLPTIRTLIEQGLAQIKGSLELAPADDIKRAFSVAESIRQNTIRDARELITEGSYSDSYYGGLALPTKLYRTSRAEILSQRLPFNADLTKSRGLVEVGLARKPVYQKLLKFARAVVAERIPGADKVELDVNQEVGLVRNLVFSWITTGEPQVLLEVEYFIHGKQDFIKQIAVSESLALEQLAQATKITEPLAINYLKDLACQIGEMLGQLPNDDLSSLSFDLIDQAFRSLKANFAIVDPFYKLNILSEDPLSNGKTIWGDSLSRVIVVDGQKYRIPHPQTLKILAYQYRSTNRPRYEEIREALISAETLFNRKADLSTGKESDEKIARQRLRVDQVDSELRELYQLLDEGKVPDSLRYTHFDIERLARQQRVTMSGEADFFHRTRRSISWLRRCAVGVIKRAYNTTWADGTDARQVVMMQKGTRREIEKVHDFIRERVIGRIRSLEYLQIIRDPELYRQYESTPRYPMSEQFPAAIETTIIDILKIQSDVWRQDARDRFGINSDAKSLSRWRQIIKIQHRSVTDDLYELVKKHLGTGRLAEILEDTPVEDLLTMIDHPDINRVIQGHYTQIGSKVSHLIKAERMLDEGKLPSGLFAVEPLTKDRQAMYRRSRINSAAHTWLIGSSRDDYGEVQDDNKTTEQSGSSLAFDPTQPAARLRSAVRVLALLPDPNKLPGVNIGLSEIANLQDELTYRLRYNTSQELALASTADVVRSRILEDVPKRSMNEVEGTIEALLDAGFLRQVRINTYSLGRLFSIESEMQSWFALQERLLQAQTRTAHFIAKHPIIDAVTSAKERVSKERKQLGLWEEAQRLSLSSPLDRLIRAGLVIKVSN